MSGTLDVLLMKEDVLKYHVAGTPLGSTNLDFQMEQYIYQRKSDGTYIINLKRTWEKLLLAAHAILAIENSANVSVISSRDTGQKAVLKFAAATGVTPIAGRFTPGTFTSQIQAVFQEPHLLGGKPTSVGSHTTSLSQRSLMLIHLPLLCARQILLCAVWTLPSHATTEELSQWVCCSGCWSGKFCGCMTPSPVNTHGRSCLISTSTEILKRLKRRNRPQLKRL
ncbi:40S ribosomal protein SA [Tupaia chinensis]|uniref:40S ribosomal protein SA n=1 Tax=Tupaia chinensis TaxID=246437 RepID=L9LFR9_TUPCH|nr:40S ribosomal protein SA [Tupaia chinensis]